jgi:hypothetical protein
MMVKVAIGADQLPLRKRSYRGLCRLSHIVIFYISIMIVRGNRKLSFF